jgi:hypothetical protein
MAVAATLAALVALGMWGLQPRRVSSVSPDGAWLVRVATLSLFREIALSVLRQDTAGKEEVSVTDRATGRCAKTTGMLFWHSDMFYSVRPLAVVWHPDGARFMVVYDAEDSLVGVRADGFRIDDGAPVGMTLDQRAGVGAMVVTGLNSNEAGTRNAIRRAIDEDDRPLKDAGLCWQPSSGPKRAAGLAPEVPWVYLDACARGSGRAVTETSAYNIGADHVEAQATWSDDGITIKVRARDGAHVPIPSGRELARGDGLWIAFGPYVQPSGPSWYYPRRKWWVGLTDKGPDVRNVLPAAEAMGEVPGGAGIRCTVTRGKDANGPRTSYRVMVPWNALARRGPPPPGAAVGFALTVNDVDPADAVRYWWFADLRETSEAAGQLILLPPDCQ